MLKKIIDKLLAISDYEIGLDWYWNRCIKGSEKKLENQVLIDALNNYKDRAVKPRQIATAAEIFEMYDKYECAPVVKDLVESALNFIGDHDLKFDTNQYLEYFNQLYDVLRFFETQPELEEVSNNFFEYKLREQKIIFDETFAKDIRDYKFHWAFDKFRDYERANKSIIDTVKHGDKDLALEVVELYTNFKGDMDQLSRVVEFATDILRNKQKIKFHQLLRNLEFYQDNNFSELCGVLYNNMHGALDVEELNKPSVHSAIKRSKDPRAMFERILNNRYSMIRHEITDRDVLMEVTYDDLDYVCCSVRLIDEVHQDRERMDMTKILRGFFDEMNRAIKQGSNGKEKIGYMKRYCIEVRKQMEDNASELMVVTDV